MVQLVKRFHCDVTCGARLANEKIFALYQHALQFFDESILLRLHFDESSSTVLALVVQHFQDCIFGLFDCLEIKAESAAEVGTGLELGAHLLIERSE